MSIEKLEDIQDTFGIVKKDYSTQYSDTLINNFMQETITTFKDQSDMIAGLRQELAKKMKEVDQKEGYYPKKEVAL